MNKRIKITVLAVCLILVAACGSDDTNNGQTVNTNNQTTTMTNNSTTSATNNGTTAATNNNTTNATNNGTTTATNNGQTIETLTTGSPCKDAEDQIQCSNGFCATSDDDTCNGICTAFVGTGEDCGNGEGYCNFETEACDFQETKKCIVRRSEGESCNDFQCELGLFCKRGSIDDAKGICAEPIALNEPCPGLNGCDAGLYCDISNESQPQCIEKNLELGDDCNPLFGLGQGCKEPNVCDFGGTEKCIARSAPIECD